MTSPARSTADNLMRGPRIGSARIPYEPPPTSVRLGVERALYWAWQQLLQDNSGTAPDPLTASEDELSEELQRRLNDIDEQTERTYISRFTTSHFEQIERGPNYKNYSGTTVKKAPDLVFKPIRFPKGVCNATDYGLFVECKIVDGQHPAAKYLSHGLRKFVNGDYAWAMSVAIMVAYVRMNCEALEYLGKRLQRGGRYWTKQPPTLQAMENQPFKTCASIHERRQLHPPTRQPLGDIEVTHLWLHVSKTK